jgi:predicted XRE-type DNA-binding protein
MTDAQHIAQALTQRRIAQAVGVVPSAVNNQVKRGVFPAAWYLTVADLCQREGIDCPHSAFNFKAPAG